MTGSPPAAAPKLGAAATVAAADAARPAEPQAGEWTLFHGIRMTKRLKTHILRDPQGEYVLYARTLDEVLFYLYDHGVTAFSVIDGRRSWQLRIAAPPGVPSERSELDYG